MSEFKEELQKDVINPDTGLTHQEEAFLNLLFDKFSGNIRACMDEVGMKDLPTSYVNKKLKNQIKERTKDFLSAESARAAIQLQRVLIDPTAPGAKTVITAAKEVLDRGGVFKEEDVKVTEIRNMFILPAKEEVLDEEVL